MYPVILIVFNRPEHTRRTLEALLKQRPEELFVFQDGARDGRQDDVERCLEVRNVIAQLTYNIPWLTLHTEYSNHNRGCREAVKYAITTVLQQREAAIIVEDDIVTSPAFLSFMNQALEHYRNYPSVFSISGYSHATERFTIPADYNYDVYCSPRLFNWGWGTWANRWQRTDWTMGYYDHLRQHPAEIEAFNRGGDDMMPMLTDEHEGRSSAWDIQFAYAHFANHAVSIVPCQSYTANIGCDGSGTHCGTVNHAEAMPALCQRTDIRWLDTLYFDKSILNAQYNIFCYQRRPLWQKAINRLARLLGCQPPFKIKRPIYA